MGRKLYVGNLSYNTSDSDLQTMFGEFGTVRSAQVITDRDTGRSKGFGFVEMGSDQEAQAAAAALNGKDMNGRALTVNEARPKEGGGGGGGRGGYGGGGGGGGRGGFGGGGGGAGVAAGAAAAGVVAAAAAAVTAAVVAAAAAGATNRPAVRLESVPRLAREPCLERHSACGRAVAHRCVFPDLYTESPCPCGCASTTGSRSAPPCGGSRSCWNAAACSSSSASGSITRSRASSGGGPS